MVSLLKRGKKDEERPEASAAAPEAEPAGDTAAVAAPEQAAPPPPAEAAPEPTAQQPAANYEPPPYQHTEPSRPFRSATSGGLAGFLDVGASSAAERERIAAMEWEQAIAPALELMRASVPEASTPEEAARILSENQGEITPDPRGGGYVSGDAYDRDARVYYRLLRRDYEKTPRPSEKRQVSHHLHQAYGKLPGTRGW